MTLPSGSRLGPYEILSPVGAGGMGEVYRARDSRLGRDVAIKVLPEEWHSDPERLRRFEQEAKAAGALNHPNLLAVYDVGTHAWDFRAAEQSFRRAIALNPSHVPALQWCAWTLNAQQRYQEGLDCVRRAAELDPLSVVIATESSWPLMWMACWRREPRFQSLLAKIGNPAAR
jgi:serine/threonine protein kinase